MFNGLELLLAFSPLSARVEHSHGEWQAAIDDLIGAWVFARHVAGDRAPSSWFYNYGFQIERRLVPLAAAWLPTLDKQAVQKFHQRLNELPVMPTLSDDLIFWRDCWLVWLRNSAEKRGLDWVKQRLCEISGHKELADSLTSKERLFAMMEETGRLFDEAIRLAPLPLGEFTSAAQSLQKKVSAGNPLARLSFEVPDLVAWKSQESKYEAMMAMLSAAIAMRLDGHDGFEKVRDPFGSGPFQYVASNGGYTLTSHLTIEGKPVSVRFGEGAIPAVEKQLKLSVYDSKANPEDQIHAALETAQKEKKLVLIQWGFNGCIPCYGLHRMLEQSGKLSEIVRTGYVHIAIDVTNEASKVSLKKYNVEMPGVPRLTVLDSSGAVLANIRPDEMRRFGELNEDLIRGVLEKWATKH